MHDPNFDNRLDPRVFPAWTSIASVIFAAVLVGAIALQALGGGLVV